MAESMNAQNTEASSSRSDDERKLDCLRAIRGIGMAGVFGTTGVHLQKHDGSWWVVTACLVVAILASVYSLMLALRAYKSSRSRCIGE